MTPSDRMTGSRGPFPILPLMLCVALLVRVLSIRKYQYSPDEMLFLIIARGQTLAEVWQRGLAELHPPLAHFIRHYLLLAGDDAFVQRLFSVAASMTAILGMYRFGRTLRGPQMGLFCAACMAFLPVAVSTSITIRNYAFFMAFLSWALVFFVRWQQQGRRRDLIGFVALIFLASTTHFSGFFAAAICGLAAGAQLARAGSWRKLAALSFAYVPLVLLAAFLYYHYRDTLAMWDRLTDAMSAGIGTSPWSGVATYFIPFLHLLRRESITEPGIPVFLALAGGIALAVLHLAGLFRMRRQDSAAFILVFAAWLVAAALTLSGFYPIAATRHYYFFLPFFILPFWYAIEPAATTLLQRRGAAFGATTAICLLALGMKAIHYYEWYGDELTLKQEHFDAGQAHLAAHLQPGDTIVTTRIAAYFYLLYARDSGQTPYDAYADFPYFGESLVLAPFDPVSKPHGGWPSFRASLRSHLDKPGAARDAKIWFVMYGAKSIEIWHLMACPAIQRDIADFFSRENVMIFSLRSQTLAAFLRDDHAWERCYAGYRPLISTEIFPAVRLPYAITGNRR